MRKIVFPRSVLPIVVAGSAVLNNAVLLAATLVAYLLLGHGVGTALVWLPLLVLLNLAFALGLGLVLGTLNVFVRDVGQAVPHMLQFIFWFTPIVYRETILPEPVRTFLALNPLYWIVGAYHDALAFGRAPNLVVLAVVGLVSLGLLALALTLFRRASADLVDVL